MNAMQLEVTQLGDQGDAHVAVIGDLIDDSRKLARARGKGGDVRVRTSRPHIRRLMELTGLSRVFRMQAPDSSASEVAA